MALFASSKEVSSLFHMKTLSPAVAACRSWKCLSKVPFGCGYGARGCCRQSENYKHTNVSWAKM